MEKIIGGWESLMYEAGELQQSGTLRNKKIPLHHRRKIVRDEVKGINFSCFRTLTTATTWRMSFDFSIMNTALVSCPRF